MAPTFTVLEEVRGDPYTIVHGTILFDSSYPTGGEAVVASDFNLWGLDWVWTTGADDAKVRGAWDKTNSKMKLYIEDGTSGIEAEAGSASNQSAIILPVIAVGVK